MRCDSCCGPSSADPLAGRPPEWPVRTTGLSDGVVEPVRWPPGETSPRDALSPPSSGRFTMHGPGADAAAGSREDVRERRARARRQGGHFERLLCAGDKRLDGQSGAEDLQPGCSPHPGENRFGFPPVGQMDQRRVCDFRPHPAQSAGLRASGRPSARALPSSCHGMLKNGTHSAERAPREMSSAAVVNICAPVIRRTTTISWAHSLPIPRPRPHWPGVLGVCSRPGGSSPRPGF